MSKCVGKIDQDGADGKRTGRVASDEEGGEGDAEDEGRGRDAREREGVIVLAVVMKDEDRGGGDAQTHAKAISQNNSRTPENADEEDGGEDQSEGEKQEEEVEDGELLGCGHRVRKRLRDPVDSFEKQQPVIPANKKSSRERTQTRQRDVKAIERQKSRSVSFNISPPVQKIQKNVGVIGAKTTKDEANQEH